MSKLIPKIASSRQIQTQYRKLFDEVIEKKEPLIVLNNNKPEVVIIDVGTFELFNDIKEKYEEGQARNAIEIYEREKKNGTLKEISSLSDNIE